MHSDVLSRPRSLPLASSPAALANKVGSTLFRHEIAYVLGQMQAKTAIPRLLSVLADASDDPIVRHEVREGGGGGRREERKKAHSYPPTSASPWGNCGTHRAGQGIERLGCRVTQGDSRFLALHPPRLLSFPPFLPRRAARPSAPLLTPRPSRPSTPSPRTRGPRSPRPARSLRAACAG
jgi:hypothetical protein